MEPLIFLFSESTPLRLDFFLSKKIPDYSRSHLTKLIKKKMVTVDSKPVKPSLKLKLGQTIKIILPPPPSSTPIAQSIPLEVLYENEHLIIINKPSGMVVHPGCGHHDGTLVNALLHSVTNLSTPDDPTRMGIVHRLDKDTSGVILVAKTNQAHSHIADQFKERTIEKEYIAITNGHPPFKEGVVDHPLGRSKRDRKKIALRKDGKPAFTKYKIKETKQNFALLHIYPKTGRTHQIRVHLQSLKTPILCDPFYGRESKITEKMIGLKSEKIILTRLALHAFRLKISLFGEILEFQAPFPEDLQSFWQRMP